MNDQELAALRAAAEAGDRDAEDELVQGLAEVGCAGSIGLSGATPTPRTYSWNSPRNARITTSSRG